MPCNLHENIGGNFPAKYVIYIIERTDGTFSFDVHYTMTLTRCEYVQFRVSLQWIAVTIANL